MDISDILEKETFEEIVPAHKYEIPKYRIVPGQGIEPTGETIQITFVRGSKDPEDKAEPMEGTLHEHLLAVMIHDLQLKTKEVPSRETSIVITKLQEALQWTRERQIDRAKREVLGTKKA